LTNVIEQLASAAKTRGQFKVAAFVASWRELLIACAAMLGTYSAVYHINNIETSIAALFVIFMSVLIIFFWLMRIVERYQDILSGPRID
jgi:hypothetical protein